jgi:hypothetical protein
LKSKVTREIKMGFINVTDDPLGNWHTIDKNRGITLRNLYGPSREGEYEFELDINGSKVIFAGTSGMKYSTNPELAKKAIWDFDWNFYRLSISKDIKLSRRDIVEIIDDALRVYGDNYNQNGADKISITFLPELL